MSYNAVVERLRDLILGFREAPEEVLADSAMADIDTLWGLVRPADPDRPTEAEFRRLVHAQITEGWLRFLRWDAGPNGRRAGDIEYDSAVVLLAPFAGDPHLLPEPLYQVLGPAADEGMRLAIATDLFERAQNSDEPATLDGSIILYSAAVEGTGGVDSPVIANLANAHLLRFFRRGDFDDIDRAVELGERAVAEAPADDVRLGVFLADLTHAYSERFMVLDDRGDADKAVETGVRAIGVQESDPGESARRLRLLSCCYRTRFERYRQDPADLDHALELAEQAVVTIRDSSSLSALASVYSARFWHTWAESDLDEAVGFATQAVAVDPPGSGDRGDLLARLSSAHREKFIRSRAIADLDQAIETGEGARVAGLDTLVGEVFHRHHLGVAYRLRFEAAGVLTDLDQAIEAGEHVRAHAPEGHADLGMFLASLASSYRLRAEAGLGTARSARDLDRAIELCESALSVTPPDHPQRPTRLSHAVAAYLQRSERGDGLADLDRAAELGAEAVEMVAGLPDFGPLLSNLGLVHQRRYVRTGEQADLADALRLTESAVRALPRENAARAAAVTNLALVVGARPSEAGKPVDTETLSWLADEALLAGRGRPRDRMLVCQEVGTLALRAGHPEIATTLLDAAIAVLPTIRPREGSWTDQAQQLRGQTRVVSTAVAAHCAAGDPAAALQAAELGRGIILGAQLDARSDLSALAAEHPVLARDFENVRERLGTVGEETDSGAGIDLPGRLRRLWEQYDDVVDRIRKVPPFERFLMAPSVPELCETVERGSVVMLNAAAHAGDAVIVAPGRAPRHVPLPGLSLAALEAHAAALQHVTTTRFVTAHEPVLPQLLEWLWTTIVERVLEHVEPGGPGRALPRVRWMPLGLLGLFPLHAAGPVDGPGALDAVVSSYTSTMRALAHARSRPVTSARRQLTVAIEHAPGLRPLPGARAEAGALRAACPDSRELLDDQATTENVLRALPEATWVHFACHATADHITPSRTGLHVQDGVLPLTRISGLELSAAEFAYLSACSTADRGLFNVEESLHLASAFQLAGFRHVVGSLWPLTDGVAVRASRSFYARMPEGATAEGAAAALHEVSRELRNAYRAKPHLWAGLIHTG